MCRHPPAVITPQEAAQHRRSLPVAVVSVIPAQVVAAWVQAEAAASAAVPVAVVSAIPAQAVVAWVRAEAAASAAVPVAVASVIPAQAVAVLVQVEAAASDVDHKDVMALTARPNIKIPNSASPARQERVSLPTLSVVLR